MGGLRAPILSPTGAGLFFERDGALSWADGLLVPPDGAGEPMADVLLIPGLVDAHVHLPQYRVRGRFQEALLPWLREHIWPEEARFGERAYREGVTSEFRDGLIAAGTTAALVYGAPSADTAHAVLRDLAPLCIRGGDVLMDRNSPEDLLRDTEDALETSRQHAEGYGERYVLTPRFAPTCSPRLMAGCGSILAVRDVGLQTHLAENLDEVAWVAELHPDRRSYTDVYAHFGLLGPRSVFGHCIHLDDQDLQQLADSGSWVAHCPTSNIALGSGRMPLERHLAAGVNVALATDVGAGPDLSMLDVMRSFLEVHEGAAEVSPGQALRLATLAGARAMGEGSQRGVLLPGRAADVVAVRIPGGVGRGESGEAALRRALFAFEGRYEEAIAGVWVAGERLR